MLKTKEIKVGFQKYRLEVNSEELAARGLHGECYKDQAKIGYCDNIPKEQLADTLIHETLHAIWNLHIDEPEAEEEKAVTMLAHGLAQVIQDNPEFIEELQSLL